MQAQINPKRPRYLNLVAIRLPLPGIVSILHRISGMYLIAALPFMIWALSAATASQAGYQSVAAVMANPFIKLLLLGVIWSCCHHICCGVRLLLLDLRIGIELQSARLLSIVVLVASLALTALLGYSWLL